MSKPILSCVLSVCACVFAHAESPDFSGLAPERVVRVEDGPNITLAGGQGERLVSLLGVKAPGADAQQAALGGFLRNLLLGEEVYVIADEAALEDRPGDASSAIRPSAMRVCLYRAPDGLFVNLEVVRQGYATTASTPVFRQRDVFRAHEQAARKFGRGIHARQPTASVPPAQTSQRDPVAAGGARPAGTAGETVYVTRSGKKYHRQTCQYVKNGGTPMSLAEASKKYEPCSRCRPPAP